MEQGVIKVERELRSRLRQVTREELGPEATAAQVEALADAAYHGPTSVHNREETDAERAERQREVDATIAMMERWNI